MALQTFTWNNGTNDNPVSLNAQQLANLVKLASKENIAKDVKGHITTSSGIISRYDKYVLNNAFEDLVIHATEQSDSFSISASKITINEGETTNIIVTGMAANSVDFALEHTVTGRNGIDENAVKAKIHMNGNTLIVDAPQENASWQDIVRVKAKPVYEDWNNESAIRYVDITVKAVALSGITLIGTSTIPVGESSEIDVTLIPLTCTKSSGISFSNTLVSDGSLPVLQPTVINNKIYVNSPAEECNLTLTTNVHLFGNTDTIAFFATKEFDVKYPFIKVVVTTNGTLSDIASANPKVTITRTKTKDGDSISAQDQEIVGVNKFVLNGVQEDNTLVYTFGGGNVHSNGIEEFKIELDHVRMYVANYVNTIQPTGVENIVQASYSVSYGQVTLVYTDGTEESYDTFMDRGTPISGKTPICVGVISDDVSFLMKGIVPWHQQNGSQRLVSISTNSNDYKTIAIDVRLTRAEAELDFASKRNTVAMKTWATGRNVTTDLTFIYHIMNGDFDITINGHALEAYIPAYGELLSYKLNKNKIKNLFSLAFGITISNDNFMSSTAAPTQNEYQDGKTAEECSKTGYWTTSNNNYGGSQYYDCFIVPFYEYNFKD